MNAGVLELKRRDVTGKEMVIEVIGMDRIKDSSQSTKNLGEHMGAEPCLYQPSWGCSFP